MSFSIRTYLLLLVAAFAAPLAGILAYSIYADAERAVADARASARTLATIVAANTGRTLAANRQALENIARRPRIRALDERQCDPILRDFRELFPSFANLITVDLAGRLPCSALPQPDDMRISVVRAEWFRRALEEKRFLVSKPFVGPLTGRWVSMLVSPIRGQGEQVIGFLGLPLDLEAYDPQIAAAPMLPGTRYGLVSQDGILVWRNEDPEDLIGKSLLAAAGPAKALLAAQSGGFEDLGADGVRRLISSVPVPEANWYAFVAVPKTAIYADAIKRAVFDSLLGVVALLFLAAVAVLLAHRIVGPVRSLTAASRAIRGGRTDVRAAGGGPAELAEVVEEFNHMVDDRLRREAELLDSRARLAEATDLGHLAYWEYDCAGGRFLFNRRFYELLRTDAAAVGGFELPADAFLGRFVHADDVQRVVRHTGRSCTEADTATSAQEEVRLRCGDGKVRWFLLRFRGEPAAPGGSCRLVGAAQDIHERKSAEEQLAFLAHHDALTLLPNRVLLRDRMQQAMAHMARRERLLAVCYLDLDGFKPVNDLYGHKVGDLLLVEVAKRLANIVRSADTVARLGGDEFVLLLSDLNSVAEIEQALVRVQQEVAAPYTIGEQELQISGSIGVALFPFDHNDPDTLLRHADQAMYAAKQAGKNRFAFFDPREDERIRAEQASRERIRLALAQEEFVLHYQPKVDMRSGATIGLEALIRWQCPERGLLPPAEFLPLIEDTELIVEVGDWVLREALRQLRRWRQEGTELSVSVNIAARQIQQADFVDKLKALLAEHADILPSQLELEILETAALHDVAVAGRVMQECQSLGVGFALDDFGTGYSSLAYLKRLPAQTLKIDQAFVRDLLEDPDDLAITDGILGLARAFQRTPVAEGVETVEHGVLLMHMGCDIAQGYGIARPMPAAAVPGWIRVFQPDPRWVRAANMHWDREDFPLLAMEVEHRRWVARIAEAVEAADPFLLPDSVPNPQLCNFGRWYQREGFAHYSHLEEFKQIGARHRQVHASAAQVVALLETGDSGEARRALPNLARDRDEVVAALHRLQERVVATHRQ